MYLDVAFDVNNANGLGSGFTHINWTNNTGHAYIKKASVNIGSSEIDSYTSEFSDIYNELTDHHEEENILINKHNCKNSYLKSNSGSLKDLQMMIPLKFWFNRNIGLSLPVVAMEYNQNVNVKLVLRNPQTLINHSGDGTAGILNSSNLSSTVKMYATGIYLDEPEKKRFKCAKHEYLIEQFHQEQETVLSSNISWKGLTNPVKEIYFVIRTPTRFTEQKTFTAATNPPPATNVDATLNISALSNLSGNDSTSSTGAQLNDYFNYTFGGTEERPVTAIASGACLNGLGHTAAADHFDTLKIKIGSGVGNITQDLKASYYRTVQPRFAGHKIPQKHIYCYSFSTDPEKHQPTGTLNFSSGSSQMDFNFGNINQAGTTARKITLYVVNYNVFVVDASCNHIGLKFTN